MTPYKRILLPLDGSQLAEEAITDAVSLAEPLGAELTLLEVIEPGRPRSHAYLDGVRHRLGGRTVTVHVAVIEGSAAEAILDHASVHGFDLIVMATHGRSGVGRWVLGSVADKVLRASKVPVLLVRVAG